MKILQLVHQYLPDDVGGTEQYTQQLAAELQARNHQVHVFFRRNQPGLQLTSWEEINGVHVWSSCQPLSAAKRFQATFGMAQVAEAFRKVLIQVRPDLVHVQHLMGLPAALISQLRMDHIPYIITLHDYWWICANAQLLTNDTGQLCSGPDALWLNCGRCALARAGWSRVRPFAPLAAVPMAMRHRQLKGILDNADRVLAVSQMVAQLHQRLHMVDARRLQLVRHGIAVPEHVQKLPRPRRPGLRIGYVGGLSWQKGVHVLVEAVNQLPVEEVQLIIIGDTTAFPHYVAGLRQQATHPGIQFAGRMDHQALWSELAQLDVLVVPSLWYEGAGLVIQEAFATGLPVIASDIGALPESIQTGKNGLLFEPGHSQQLAKQLLTLLQQPAQLRQLSNGIAPVRTIDQHVDQVEGIYHQVVPETGYD